MQALRLTNDQIALILEMRQQKRAYKSKNEFIRVMRSINPTQTQQLAEIFDTNSQYFRLTGEVEINRARVFLNSLLFRTANGQVHVIMRQFSRVNEATTTNTETDVSNTPANTNG